MTVAVCDQVKLSAQILNRAKQQSTHVYAYAGVDVTWVDLDRRANCSLPTGERNYFVVVILPKAANDKIVPDTMGIAPTVSVMYPRAYVFYNRVELLVDLLRDRSYPRNTCLAIILGQAIAHELGHLLMPGGVHAPSGIMSTNWNIEQWNSALAGTLLFLEWEANAIRNQLQRR